MPKPTTMWARRVVVGLTGLALLCAAALVAAQGTGELRGEVWSLASDRPLAGVTVTLLRDTRGDDGLTVTTDAEGRFRLDRIPTGTYRVQVSRGTQVLATLDGMAITASGRRGRLLVPPSGGALRFESYPTAAIRPPPPAPPPPPSLPAPSPAPPAPSSEPGPTTGAQPPVTAPEVEPAPQPGLAVVPVFYATDRDRVAAAPLAYGTRRNDTGALALGRFDVSIPRDHEMGQVERPTIWTFYREDPTRHLVITSRRQLSYDGFYRDVGEVVRRSTRKEAFVFVHGFNVSFESAVFRTAQMAYDLGFDGAPILYSWPSAESLSPVGYATDASSADWTVPHLRYFLEDVATRSGAERVHLIAHSMGNKALVNALNRLAPSTRQPFSQILLTAPDIDADTFVELADAVKRAGQRATLYASSNDRALLASKKLQTYRRAGDTSGGVVVVPGIDTIDVSDVDTDLVGHFYYGANTSVISDMFLVLSRGALPSERPRLRPQGVAPKAYWKFVR